MLSRMCQTSWKSESIQNSEVNSNFSFKTCCNHNAMLQPVNIQYSDAFYSISLIFFFSQDISIQLNVSFCHVFCFHFQIREVYTVLLKLRCKYTEFHYRGIHITNFKQVRGGGIFALSHPLAILKRSVLNRIKQAKPNCAKR